MHADPATPAGPSDRSDRRDGAEKPPRGVRAMAIVRWAILAVALAAAVVTNARWLGEGRHEPASAVARWYCPMHPQITSDVPGECPICHMTLEPIPPERAAGAPARTGAPAPSAIVAADAGATKWTCPMHPQIVRDAPGSCPLCHMELVPLPPSPAATAAVGTTPPGTAQVTLSLDRVQAIGVRTSVVEKRRIDRSVHARAAGYVERAPVEQTGIRVRRGQELVAIYSPEIYQAEAELLATRAWDGDAAASPAASARTKLELLGVAPATIDRVIATGKPIRAIPIASPVSGFVVKRGVALGSYVTPETELFSIVDLSRVYVVADVFQRDSAEVAVGARARFVPTVGSARPVEGTIDLVYPTLGAEARTTRVRMTVANRDLALRPGDYGTLELSPPAREALVVPRDAVVETGEATYVFVAEGQGRFSPRTVAIGAEIDGAIEIRAGLAEGETVVSGATFLLDSESRLEASLAGSSAPPAAKP
jgi:Cu(I)/Ag(I) efflux system membrane fusion protein